MLNSILANRGYEVLRYACGAYWLRSRNHKGVVTGECIAVLHANGPIEADTDTLYLFYQPLTEKMPAERVFEHWQNMDSRRLGESGLYPDHVPLPAELRQELTMQHLDRPDDARSRRTVVTLRSGDVVCYC